MTDSSYLALDPGDGPRGGTTGWATFDEVGDILEIGQFHSRDHVERLTDLIHSDLKAVICEDFKNHMHLRGGTQAAKAWGKNETSKLIGKIELMCSLRGVPIYLQTNNKYRIGALWGGIEIPTNHAVSHQYVAAGHGVYWLQTNGVRPIGRSVPKND